MATGHRVRDLAGRIAMLADACDDVGVTPGSIFIDCEGHVMLCLNDPDLRLALAERLGLDNVATRHNDKGDLSTDHVGVYADVPICLHGYGDSTGSVPC